MTRKKRSSTLTWRPKSTASAITCGTWRACTATCWRRNSRRPSENTLVTTDIAIIGGGIVGLATALDLVRRFRVSIMILEAESQVAQHQTGHNSGVIHAGLYYKPGSEKARNCAEGREAMY